MFDLIIPSIGLAFYITMAIVALSAILAIISIRFKDFT